MTRFTPVLTMLMVAVTVAAACGRPNDTAATGSDVPARSGGSAEAPDSLAMGGAKSVTRFFITSRGTGRGGDLGGLAGADAHCQMLAAAEGSGDHTWRAYLSTSAAPGVPAVNARDRIGTGPWYNAEGELIAANLDQLHGDQARINKEFALTERLDPVNGVGDTPNHHDILTGSRPDGTAYPSGDDLTCGNWTSSGDGSAQSGITIGVGWRKASTHGTRCTPRAVAVSRRSKRPEEPGCSTVSPSIDGPERVRWTREGPAYARAGGSAAADDRQEQSDARAWLRGPLRRIV